MLKGITTRSPGLDVLDLAAHLLHHSHGLVAQDVALVDEGAEHLVEVQIGAADAGRGDANDRVRRLLDPRIGNGVDAHVALSMPGDSFHVSRLPARATVMQ